MKVLIINSVCGILSTGRICADIARELSLKGHQVKIAYGRETADEKSARYAVKIGNSADGKMHAIYTRLTDKHAFASKKATKEFLKWADEFNPDMLWLHNLHGYYINIELLFNWIKSRPNMTVKWTLHDCWAFTGHCAYFSAIGCDKWKTGCDYCPQKNKYPASVLIDNSKNNFLRKKSAFTGVKNMTLITPSNWLANLVKQSFLKEYPIEVVYNTVDTEIFKPRESDFREQYGLQNKKIILGVASSWDKRKGLDDFIEISKALGSDYKIVLVGLNDKQIKALPPDILGIRRTDNAEKLAEIYSAADIFVNPSREETFGMTTLEAISCGTAAIVYKDTACEEVALLHGGIAVNQNAESIVEAIKNIKIGGEN